MQVAKGSAPVPQNFPGRVNRHPRRTRHERLVGTREPAWFRREKNESMACTRQGRTCAWNKMVSRPVVRDSESGFSSGNARARPRNSPNRQRQSRADAIAAGEPGQEWPVRHWCSCFAAPNVNPATKCSCVWKNAATGDRCHDRPGRNQVPGGNPLTVQRIRACRNGLRVSSQCRNHRPGAFVPDEREREHAERHGRRFHQPK